MPYPAGVTIAFDTETTVDDLKRVIPQFVLMTVSDGKRHCVVDPVQLDEFIVAHEDRQWVGFNTTFDYHVVADALRRNGGAPVAVRALAVWEGLLVQGRLRDLMLLDYLYRLAAGLDQGVSRQRNLADVAEDYCGIEVDKKDDKRMRFGELIGEDWTDPKWREWFDYAVLDTVATARAWRSLTGLVMQMPHRPDCGKWGPFTETLQLRAAVALADTTRRGFAVDRGALAETKAKLQQEIAGYVKQIVEMVPDLFHAYVTKKRAGELKINKSTGTPRMNNTALARTLLKVAADEGLDEKRLPKTPTGRLQMGLPLWMDLAPESDFVELWGLLAGQGKLLTYLVQLEKDNSESIHSEYTPLVRTGRTSAKRPNIQQMPKEAWFRKLFVARPGYQLCIVDYSAIELRTLAAVLKNRFGASTLYDVLKGGRDPHAYTASLVLGVPYEEFLAGLKHEKTFAHGPGSALRFIPARQAAKAINFGVPGGLGAKKLAIYARRNYDVALDEGQAAELRTKLTQEVYPELQRYLHEDESVLLASSLHADIDAVREELQLSEDDIARTRAIEKIVKGDPYRADGTAYPSGWVDDTWESLVRLNKNPALVLPLRSRQEGMQLYMKLFGRTVETLTGRPRAGCRYTESRNTPFQALAADGAKVALWNLWLSGYRVVAFIHDEIVVEVEESRAGLLRYDIERIMKRSMESVLYCDLKVEVESHLSPHWGVK